MSGDVALTLPLPRAIGLGAGLVGPTGAISLTLPTPQLALGGYVADGDIALTLPKPTFAATGTVSTVGNAILKLPVPKLVATGTPGVSGSVAMMLPMPEILIGVASELALTLPTLKIAASGSTGLVGTATMLLPLPQLVLSGGTPIVGNAVMALPRPKVTITGTVGQIGSINMMLSRFALQASGSTGIVGSASLILPVLDLQATGYTPIIGRAVLTIPMLRMQATGTTGQTSGGSTDDVFRSWAINLGTSALTEYRNFNFNSLIRFAGTYLGASDEGVFVLEGSDDNGAEIEAWAKTGISDFGSSHIKSIPRAYVGYRADGNLILRVTTDGGQQRDYLIEKSASPGLHGNHARIGKGVKSRYWQYEIRNVNGADFAVNVIEIQPTTLRRRIGGRNA